MIVPVRCFSCGKTIGEHYEKYVERIQKGEKPDSVLDDIGIKRYCCRRMLYSHVDFMEEIVKYRTVK